MPGPSEGAGAGVPPEPPLPPEPELPGAGVPPLPPGVDPLPSPGACVAVPGSSGGVVAAGAVEPGCLDVVDVDGCVGEVSTVGPSPQPETAGAPAASARVTSSRAITARWPEAAGRT